MLKDRRDAKWIKVDRDDKGHFIFDLLGGFPKKEDEAMNADEAKPEDEISDAESERDPDHGPPGLLDEEDSEGGDGDSNMSDDLDEVNFFETFYEPLKFRMHLDKDAPQLSTKAEAKKLRPRSTTGTQNSRGFRRSRSRPSARSCFRTSSLTAVVSGTIY